jgi:hypothetical protein
MLGLAACQPDGPPAADLDALRLPTGIALSPDGDWMFVTNGNWDREDDASTLVAIDVVKLDAGLADPRAPGATLTAKRPCREVTDGGRVECDPSALIDVETGVRLASGAGNIAVDRPKGNSGPLRLLVPSRIEPRLTWIDVIGADGDEVELDCGEQADRRCDDVHVLSVASDPASVSVDEQGFRYAYLPHLLEDEECGDGCAGITLIGLDGEFGPEVIDVQRDFFRLDPLHDSGLRGGFAVAQRGCDLATSNVPSESRDCTRPVLYASQRFWPGVRVFRVAPGLDLIISGRESSILGTNFDNAIERPFGGDLEFEDPATGERLLLVSTTPPGFARIDTTLDDQRTPKDELMHSISLCNDPNMLEVYRPDPGENLAFVSCFSDDRVAVVSLASFSVVKTLHIGHGPNEMETDLARKRLYVVNTRENAISIVELDPTSPDYLDEVAVIGLGTER